MPLIQVTRYQSLPVNTNSYSYSLPPIESVYINTDYIVEMFQYINPPNHTGYMFPTDCGNVLIAGQKVSYIYPGESYGKIKKVVEMTSNLIF